MEHLSLRQARRIALGAQGFADPVPTGRVDARHLRRVLSRTRLLQIDSVNVFARAHHVPAFSRLGAWPTDLLDDLAFRRRELFEYWGHEASYLPVDLHPLLRWRMARAEALEEGWGGTLQVFRDHPEYVRELLVKVRDLGPVGAGALRESGPRRTGSWWSWDLAKRGLEYLFWSGRLTTARRTTGFERLYDLTERVLPAEVLARPTPEPQDAQRELVRLAAAAHGVATERDLRDYFRLRPQEGRAAVQELLEEGGLQPVRVEGWRDVAYLAPGATPRRVRRAALLSPFDPLVWERARTERLWHVDYRIEIYVPADKRVYGYYCLLLLEDEAITARVDLKADRRDRVLRVAAAWAEPDARPGTAAALAEELRRAAAWQGLDDVVVEQRGDLAAPLSHHL